MGQIWLIMTQDDWLWPRMTYQGSWGHQGVQGGARGHQGVPGGSRIPLAPKRVIKQQNNDPKPWFKVPKVCPDLKGMVFTHLWCIWGHLGALKQRYLVKLQYRQKPHFRKKNSLTITQTTRCKFWLVSQFSNYHRYVTVLGKLRNQSKVAPGSLRNCQKIGVIFFFRKWGFIFQQIVKNTKK